MVSRLKELGVVDVKWDEDDDGNVQASGLQDYDIDADNELAVFQGDKCIKVYDCVDFCHAVAMVYAQEAVCRWNLRNGKTGNGRRINERGWQIPGRA
jgi:Na+-translocating ferredoxin:NAD+ oxidoreductase RNF subunit RnfB